MKNLMLTLFIALTTFSVSIAQEGAGQKSNRQQQFNKSEERATMEVKRLHEKLNLSQIQQDSILNFMKQENARSQNRRGQNGADRQVAFEKMKELREERNTKIKSFLTKEQVEKYDELLKQREQNRAQRQQKKDNRSNSSNSVK